MDWITPCNTLDYALADAFAELGKIEWGQSRSMKEILEGDTLYIYESKDVHELGWKCRVTSVNRTVSLIDDSKFSRYSTSNDPSFIEICPELHFTLRHMLSLKVLRKHGLSGNVQGPCRISPELSAYIQTIEAMESNAAEHEFQSIPLDKLKAIAKAHSITNPKVRRISTKVIYRDRYISTYAKYRAKGHCQLCGLPAPFQDKAGHPYLETHHIVWLSDGGADSLGNTVALCPNCHRKMHILNDQEDIKRLNSMAAEA